MLFRSAKDPVGYFTSTFCDGKNGRPADFAAFATEWATFLENCYRWLDPRRRDASTKWIEQYGGLGEGESGPLVLDEPTWSWARNRAEPFFGQGHAAAAGEILRAAGMPAAAALAYLASLQCEGWSAAAALGAAELLQQVGRLDAASAARQLGRSRFPVASFDPAPSTLLPQLARTKAYLDQLAQLAGALRQGNGEVAAGALQAEHERLALRLALPHDATTGIAMAPPPVPRSLASFGWVEDSLTGYDERRAKGLWYATAEGDLHVGREKPKDSTGALDRAAHQRQCFARSADWIAAGDYVVRMRIHFTTSYVNGAVIFGHSRRDRDLRLSFSAGDYEYAVGRSEKNEQFQNVQLNLRGLWERDGQLPQTAPGTGHELKEPSSFLLELRVRGPSVLVKVDGEALFRYTVHDGAPIEGSVGFAMGQGAIRVQQPTVQRLDVTEPGQALAAVEAVGLDLSKAARGERDRKSTRLNSSHSSVSRMPSSA